MDVRKVSDDFAVAAQLHLEDMSVLAKERFVAIICNRPDGEEPGQPTASEMRDAAQTAGLAFHHIPVSGGEFPEPAVAAFKAIRLGTQGKVVAYCRTGTRSITLETLANPHNLSAEERFEVAREAGYDLSALAGRLCG
ncbi:TIGR01244 family sulfur transferase [Altererythrobacter sp. GH1-8]|uniref:TIGR01244 family sulfur transferase n=1 Tax=Altererythrobacter sp. GH1-8 TaxID=3349333 RepID=UPI00374DDA65